MTNSIHTTKFGEVAFGETDVIHVSEGLPGFNKLRQFLLIENELYEPLRFFQSVDNPMISFPLIDPRLVREDYRLALTATQRKELGLDCSEEGLVYSIVTLGGLPSEASANLFAPLVINTSKMLASQVILLDSDYSVTEPLLMG